MYVRTEPWPHYSWQRRGSTTGGAVAVPLVRLKTKAGTRFLKPEWAIAQVKAPKWPTSRSGTQVLHKNTNRYILAEPTHLLIGLFLNKALYS